MSTRRLIVTSLVCGLLILVAGTAKLLQTANETPTASNLLKIGLATSINTLTVAVNDVTVTDDRTLVNVTMNGLDDESPLVGWSMLANGEITKPTGSQDCPNSGTAVTCTVEFVVAVGTPTIVYVRDGEKRQWLGS